MDFLTVPNFDHWQHYKNRTPPWIKLHRDILRDYDFNRLPDESKAHLMLLWLLASQLDNRLPNDASYLQRMIGSVTAPDIDLLVDRGFLLTVAGRKHDASKPLADRKQPAIRETEAEEDTIQEENSLSKNTVGDWDSQDPWGRP